jgi:hypothetical protein
LVGGLFRVTRLRRDEEIKVYVDNGGEGVESGEDCVPDTLGGERDVRTGEEGKELMSDGSAAAGD